MKDKLQMLAYNIGAVLIGLVISGCMLLFMKVNPLAVCRSVGENLLRPVYAW